MTKKRTKLFAAKRLRYRATKEHVRVQELENANQVLQDEITELKTSAFNYIFHMDQQKRMILS
jgi:hypothetical protein